MDLELGVKYKFEKKLGAGAFGEADIAKDNTSGKKSQLKLRTMELSKT